MLCSSLSKLWWIIIKTHVTCINWNAMFLFIEIAKNNHRNAMFLVVKIVMNTHHKSCRTYSILVNMLWSISSKLWCPILFFYIKNNILSIIICNSFQINDMWISNAEGMSIWCFFVIMMIQVISKSILCIILIQRKCEILNYFRSFETPYARTRKIMYFP